MLSVIFCLPSSILPTWISVSMNTFFCEAPHAFLSRHNFPATACKSSVFFRGLRFTQQINRQKWKYKLRLNEVVPAPFIVILSLCRWKIHRTLFHKTCIKLKRYLPLCLNYLLQCVRCGFRLIGKPLFVSNLLHFSMIWICRTHASSRVHYGVGYT